MRSPLFLLGLSTPQVALPTGGFLSPLWLLGLSGETGVIPPVTVFSRGGHNDDDEVMAVIMAFMGVIHGR
jgi:hypothetical protein